MLVSVRRSNDRIPIRKEKRLKIPSYLTVRIVVFLHFHHLLHDPRLELLVLRIQELQVGLVFDDGQPAAEDLGERKTR